MIQNVVVITHAADSVEMLVSLGAHLEARGASLLQFNTDRYPMECHASFLQDGGGERIVFGDGSRRVVLGPADAIWYRRAWHGAALPEAMDRQLRAAAAGECAALVNGLMAAAPCFVLDGTDRVRWNEHKARQQRLAREVGLATPRTLMTNDPVEARAFIASCPTGAVAKMLSSFAIRPSKDEEQVVFTSALGPEHLRHLDGLRYSPVVFQERIDKRLELRVTMIGTRVFAAAVDSMAVPGADVDWRERGVELVDRFVAYTLPAGIEAKLHAYMTRSGMQYSAIDFIVEPSGRYVFLEANPAGEFFWLEHFRPHFPMTEALADVLLNKPGARRHFT